MKADTEDKGSEHATIVDSLGAQKEDTYSSHDNNASIPVVSYNEQKDLQDDQYNHTRKECLSLLPRCQPFAIGTQKEGTQVVPKDGASITISLKDV